MAFLIAALLFATLFSENVHCMSENETTNTSEANDAISAVDVLSLLPVSLDEQKLIHGPKNKLHTPIGNFHPEDSNRTEDSVALDGGLGTDVNRTEHPVTIAPANGPGMEGLPHKESIDHDHSTESKFDSKGCDTHLRDEYEEDCFKNFQNAISDSADMEDGRGKHICCAAESYERCCVIGYQEANCVTDWDGIKENLKAARMFMATLSNTSCSLHRGKCNFESAAYRLPLPSFLLATLIFLPTIFTL